MAGMGERVVLITLAFLLGFLAFASAARPSKTIQDDFPAPPPADQGPSHVCQAPRFAKLGLDMADYLYCDSSLPFDVRAKDLVDRMTLDEKVNQVGNLATGVPRIGLPKYQWWSEALHGVSNVGPGTFFDNTVPGATSFPTVILSAAAFNQSLWKSIGQAVSSEARAMYNLGKAGLTYWSPNVNVVRDPRWGRAIETPGEDPYVVGTFATNYVRGLQDVPGTENTTDLNSRPLKVSSCCKHHAAYDVDAWKGVDRYHFDARVTEQDMRETFLRPFEMCVKDGDVSSVMCSYNRVNGIPACADTNLLKNTIRGEWDLHGYIVSDCDSIEVMIDGHKWLGDTKEDAVAQVLKAGLDLNCGDYYTKALGNSVRRGEVKEADIDKSLKYLYVVLMRLGFFDGNPQFNSLGKNDVCSDANLELATEAAREGIVLLKNEDKTLPLKSCDINKIAVIGPHANATSAMIGNYAGIPCGIVTPFEGISEHVEVAYEKGCSDIACKDDSLIFSAMNAAKNADATILLVGLDLSVEAESLDRNDLLLPGYQTQLINQVAESSSGPLVVVIMSAGGIDISFAKNNPKIKAILWAGYPGEKGGTAIADVIFGKYNPGGRLPLTWYEAGYVDMLPMTSMPLRPVDSFGYPGRTYKFFNGSTVYPFGYGLSYTDFSYSLASPASSVNIKLNKFQHCHNVDYSDHANINTCPSVVIDDLECGYKFGFEVAVKNVGEKDGSDVIMVYSKPPEGLIGSHYKQLIGFERVFVKSGATENVKFEFDACKSLNIVDNSGYNLLPSGGHIIMAGDNVISLPVEVSYSN